MCKIHMCKISILNSKKKHEQRLAKRSRHTRVYQKKIP